MAKAVAADGSLLYICWPSNRTLRDQIETCLLIHSGSAWLTVDAKQIKIQVVDRFRTSAFQRVFHCGIDYQMSESDPLASTQTTPPHQKALEWHWESMIDIGCLYDILSGSCAPSGLEDDVDVEEQEDEEEEEKRPAKKSKTKATSGKGVSAKGLSARGLEKEEKVAWKLFRNRSCSTLQVKVRFITLEVPKFELPPSSKVDKTPITSTSTRYKTTDWETVPLSVPSTCSTTFNAPLSARLSAPGARVSMRCASDLQDDIMHLITFSDKCDLSVTPTCMRLTSKPKLGRKGYILQYELARSAVAAPTATGPTTPTGKTAKKTAHTPSRFSIDFKSTTPKLEARFHLRTFRIIHKIVGASSRVQWEISSRPDRGITVHLFQGAATSERLVGSVLTLSPQPSSKLVT